MKKPPILTDYWKGVGKLLIGELTISQVRYEVKVYQDVIKGMISVPESEKYKEEVLQPCTNGAIMILVLNDGRRLNIVLPFAKPYLDYYEFSNAYPGGFF